MGHVRLGTLPHTRSWTDVIDLIANGADVPKVAEAVIKASQSALKFVQNDVGFREAAHLLMQLGVAATKKDPVAHMASVGVIIPKDASALDIALALKEGLERNVNATGRRSEFGQKASDALVGAVTQHLEGKMPQLFGPNADDVSAAMASLRKKSEFGELGREFFARLTHSSMDWFLSRTLATHLGDNQAFPTMNQMRQFEDAMKTRCDESSKIVKDFCADWSSKARHEGGGDISKEEANIFGWVAMKKMRSEFTIKEKGKGQRHGK